MHCVIPDVLESANSAIVEVTTDGLGFTDSGFSFQYLNNCSQRRQIDDNMTSFGVLPVAEKNPMDWWPWLFFLLLPLLCCLLVSAWCCCRRKPKERQRQVVSTTETSPDEEAFQIEGLETSTVPDSSPSKWKIQPAAYIGFGKGKMDVNWNGEAPESAPHEVKRQQVFASTLENPSEDISLTSPGLAHVAGGKRTKKRGCCPWLCCTGSDEPQYPRNEGEQQHLAVFVPRVVFHADNNRVDANTTLESKDHVEG